MASTAAAAIAAYNANHNVAAQTVADSAADLLNYLSGLQALAVAGKLVSVSLSGTSNSVTATQAASLATLRNFALSAGATLLVADTAANLLAPANAAGVGNNGEED